MNNYYKLYVESVLNLAETIVIKLDDAAMAMNYAVMMSHGLTSVDEDDKSSWKYYQNISGRYHFSDSVIQVNSLDTTDVIDFTIENLDVHLATREAYAFGSRYYKELILQNPDQELLILGILYPSDMQEAIDAKDGTIINYPKALIEVNEYSLLSKLQAWIYKYLDRWVNRQFAISDDLYVASYIGQLYLHLVQAIFSFRLEACKTNEAHSFHIQQYLASHGMLDVYLSNMTRQQALFFYRNILYIQRHSGKKDTFEWLVDSVMTHRNLPLYEYTMSHDVSGMNRTSPLEDTNLLPGITFKRKPLNVSADDIEKTGYTLDHVLSKIEELAPGNAIYHEDNRSNIENAFAYSMSSVGTTKLLESSVIDYSDAVVYTLESALFNHWLALVAKGIYTATVVIDLPASGSNIRLEASDAVALFLYALHTALDTEPEDPGYAPLLRIPKIQANRIVRSPAPLLTELTSITERKYLSLAEVNEIFATRITIPAELKSISGFYNTCKNIYTAAQLQYAIYASKENRYARGDAQAAVSRLYSDEVVRLTDLASLSTPALGMTYVDFLQTLGLDFEDYTKVDFYNLALSIVLEATGVSDLPPSSLREMQKAMVNLFSQLSSYSIQVITEINESNIIVVSNPAIRIGEITVIESNTDLINSAPIRVKDVYASENHSYKFDLNDVFPLQEPAFTESSIVSMDFTSRVRQLTDFHSISPCVVYAGIDVRTSFDFDASARAMTRVMRDELVDMYCEGAGSLSDVTVKSFTAFKYVSRKVALDLATYVSRRRVLPKGFVYVGRTKDVTAFSSTHEQDVDVFELFADEQDLEAFSYVGNVETLPGFSYSGGTIGGTITND